MNTPKQSNLPDYLTRMRDEEGALGCKVISLSKFLYSDAFYTLPLPEQHRLIKQYVFMSSYRDVLKARIKFAFEQLNPSESKDADIEEA